MARRDDITQFNLQLTREQYEALAKEADAQEKPMSVLIRELIAKGVPEFNPRKIIRRDPYKWEVRRKKSEE